MGKRQKKRYREKYRKAEVLTAICFLLPAVFMWLYWFFIPAIKSMRLSFYNYSYVTPERTEFVGFDNFVRLFHDKDFLKALQHTFLMVAVVVLLIAVLAFLIAVLLDGNLRGKTFFRTVYVYAVCHFCGGSQHFLHVLLCKGWNRKPVFLPVRAEGYDLVYQHEICAVSDHYYLCMAADRLLYDSVHQRPAEYFGGIIRGGQN